MTTISRDRIQFEDIANEVEDGNGQMHRDAALGHWMAAANEYLAAHGGGDASVRIAKDTTRFYVSGDRAIADAADSAGWDAARKYIDEQIAAMENE